MNNIGSMEFSKSFPNFLCQTIINRVIKPRRGLLKRKNSISNSHSFDFLHINQVFCGVDKVEGRNINPNFCTFCD